MELTTWNLPVLALRGLTVFPHMTLTFDVERPISIAALERAMEADQDIFLVTQREIGVNAPEEKDLYTIGTVSHITQILRLGQSSVRVMVEGRQRAHLRRHDHWTKPLAFVVLALPPGQCGGHPGGAVL